MQTTNQLLSVTLAKGIIALHFRGNYTFKHFNAAGRGVKRECPSQARTIIEVHDRPISMRNLKVM